MGAGGVNKLTAAVNKSSSKAKKPKPNTNATANPEAKDQALHMGPSTGLMFSNHPFHSYPLLWFGFAGGAREACGQGESIGG